MKVKGYIIKDTNSKVVILEKTGLYKNKKTGNFIPKSISEPKKEVVVDEWEDLILLHKKRIPHKYVNKDSLEELTFTEYNDKVNKLLEKSIDNGDYEEISWESLEDEFAYRKFISSHETLYETIYEEEEIVIEKIKEVTMETGNPFIKSLFCGGHDYHEINVFEYDRLSAVKEILKNKMKELGVRYVVDKSWFKEEYSKEKVWDNPNHSGIRFARLNGKYIFGRRWEIKHSSKGTLENMRDMYEKDKKDIEYEIDLHYKKMFGEFDNANTKHVVHSLQIITDIQGLLEGVEVYKKSSDDYYKAVHKINGLEKQLSKVLKA